VVAQNRWSVSKATTTAAAFSKLWISEPMAFNSLHQHRREAKQAVSCAKYPTAGTRSVYFPQRSMNKAGLLGYAGTWNTEASSRYKSKPPTASKNISEIAAIPGVDILFLGQNDLCMSMGLYEKYEFPLMYTSPELNAATQSLVEAAHKNNVILGSSSSVHRASVNFSTKVFPSSALATISITYSRKLAPTSPTWRKSPKKKASSGRAVPPRFSNTNFSRTVTGPDTNHPGVILSAPEAREGPQL